MKEGWKESVHGSTGSPRTEANPVRPELVEGRAFIAWVCRHAEVGT